MDVDALIVSARDWATHGVERSDRPMAAPQVGLCVALMNELRDRAETKLRDMFGDRVVSSDAAAQYMDCMSAWLARMLEYHPPQWFVAARDAYGIRFQAVPGERWHPRRTNAANPPFLTLYYAAWEMVPWIGDHRLPTAIMVKYLGGTVGRRARERPVYRWIRMHVTARRPDRVSPDEARVAHHLVEILGTTPAARILEHASRPGTSYIPRSNALKSAAADLLRAYVRATEGRAWNAQLQTLMSDTFRMTPIPSATELKLRAFAVRVHRARLRVLFWPEELVITQPTWTAAVREYWHDVKLRHLGYTWGTQEARIRNCATNIRCAADRGTYDRATYAAMHVELEKFVARREAKWQDI